MTGSRSADDKIYRAFRLWLPNVNVARVVPVATAAERDAWARLMAYMANRCGIACPRAPSLLAVDADVGYTPDNTLVVCYAVAVATEIARRRELPAHVPSSVDC